MGDLLIMHASSHDARRQTASLYEIILWVRDTGEIQAENRLRIRTLPFTVREGISFAQIGPSTQASSQLVSAMIREAALVVGKPFTGLAGRSTMSSPTLALATHLN